MNLIDKIDQIQQAVADLKEKLKQAQDSNNTTDIQTFEDRIHAMANQRWALKEVYIEAISEAFDISIEELIAITGGSLDLTLLRDKYKITVTALQ